MLILLFFLMAVSGVGLVHAADDPVTTSKVMDDWQRHHYVVYTLKGSTLSPERIFQELYTLENLYKGRDDPNSKLRLKKVQDLLLASRANICDGQSFSHIEQQLAYNSPFKVNVIPFLNYHYDRLINQCRPGFEVELSDARSALTPDVTKNMETFLNRLPVDGTHTKEELLEDLVAFVEHFNQEAFIERPLEENKLVYQELAHQMLDKLCSEVHSSIDPVVEKFGLLSASPKLVRRLGGVASRCVIMSKVCNDLNSNPKDSVDESFDRVRKRSRTREKNFGEKLIGVEGVMGRKEKNEHLFERPRKVDPSKFAASLKF